MRPAAASADRSRSAKLQRGQQFLDGGKPSDALRDFPRAFTDQLIASVKLVAFCVVVDGCIFGSLARHPGEMRLHFLRGKEISNVANKSRQLRRKFRTGGRGINKVEQ